MSCTALVRRFVSISEVVIRSVRWLSDCEMSYKLGFQIFRRMSSHVAKINNYDRCLQQLKMTHLGDGRCTAEFRVADEHLNRAGNLHGGFTASLVELVTSDVILVNKDHPPGPVSVDLHVAYLKTAREGDEVVVDVSTVHAGRRMAFLECEIRKKKDNAIIARGSTRFSIRE